MVLSGDDRKARAALFWLKQGCSLFPVQPGKKYFFPGFGPKRERITDITQIRRWWYPGSNNNLAILLPDNLICFDIDDQAIYQVWVSLGLPATYTEKTRRGYHVFYQCADPTHDDLAILLGIEYKRVVLVAPSTVDGIEYSHNSKPIRAIQWASLESCFSLLSKKEQGESAMPLGLIRLATNQRGDSAPSIPPKPEHIADIITHIKGGWRVYNLAKTLTELKPSGGERWYIGRCPFHDDNNPSFWVDTEKGLFGCHACGVHGDVINLYALAHKLTVKEAIKAMAREVLPC